MQVTRIIPDVPSFWLVAWALMRGPFYLWSGNHWSSFGRGHGCRNDDCLWAPHASLYGKTVMVQTASDPLVSCNWLLICSKSSLKKTDTETSPISLCLPGTSGRHVYRIGLICHYSYLANAWGGWLGYRYFVLLCDGRYCCYAVMFGGWASANKFSLLGWFAPAAQTISCEVF